MARGGIRPGSGRPKGSKSKLNVVREQVLTAVVNSDMTPLEYMLRVMRDEEADKRRRDDMSKAAAPYIHARKMEDGEGRQISVTLNFKRETDAFSGAVLTVQPSRQELVNNLLDKHSGEVRDTLKLVFDGVPDNELREVYQRAIGTAIAAAGRGQGEVPMGELIAKPDVQEAVQGYGTNLDLETAEEKQKLEDALQKMNEHNRKVKARVR